MLGKGQQLNVVLRTTTIKIHLFFGVIIACINFDNSCTTCSAIYLRGGKFTYIFRFSHSYQQLHRITKKVEKHMLSYLFVSFIQPNKIDPLEWIFGTEKKSENLIPSPQSGQYI